MDKKIEQACRQVCIELGEDPDAPSAAGFPKWKQYIEIVAAKLISNAVDKSTSGLLLE